MPGERRLALGFVFRWVSFAAGAVALTYVAVIAVRNWRSGQVHWGALSFAGIALALVATLISLFLLAATWRWALRQLGIHADGRHAIYAWFMSNLYKYIPGQIWMPVGRTVIASRFGVPARATVVSTAVEQSYSLLAAGLLLAAALGSTAWALIVVAVSFVFVHPRAVNGAIGLFDRVLQRPAVLTPLRAPQLLVLYLVSWAAMLLAVVSVAGILLALGSYDPSDIRAYAVALTASFLGGYLFFGAPAGLGVREGVMLLVLTRAGIAKADGSTAVLLLRLLGIACEVTWFAIAAGAVRLAARARDAGP